MQDRHELMQTVERLTRENKEFEQAYRESEELQQELSARLSQHKSKSAKQPSIDECEQLQDALIEEEQKGATLKAQSAQLEREKVQLQKKLESALQRERDLRVQMEQMIEPEAQSPRGRSPGQSAFAVMQSQLDESHDRSAKLEEEVRELKSQCQRLESEKQILKGEVEDLSAARSSQWSVGSSLDTGDKLLSTLSSSSSTYGTPVRHSTPLRKPNRCDGVMAESLSDELGDSSMGDVIIPSLHVHSTPLSERSLSQTSNSTASLVDLSSASLASVVAQVERCFQTKKGALKFADSSGVDSGNDGEGQENLSFLDESTKSRLLAKLSEVVRTRAAAMKKASSLRKQVKKLESDLEEEREKCKKMEQVAAEADRLCEVVNGKLALVVEQHSTAVSELEELRGKTAAAGDGNDDQVYAQAPVHTHDDHDSTLGNSMDSDLDDVREDADKEPSAVEPPSTDDLRQMALFLRDASPSDVEKKYISLAVSFMLFFFIKTMTEKKKTRMATPNSMAPIVDLCAGFVMVHSRQIRRFHRGFFSSVVLDWSLMSCLHMRRLQRQQKADSWRYLCRSSVPWSSSLWCQISLPKHWWGCQSKPLDEAVSNFFFEPSLSEKFGLFQNSCWKSHSESDLDVGFYSKSPPPPPPPRLSVQVCLSQGTLTS